MDTINFRIESTSPLLMQAETLANPLHPLTKAHKAVSSKRKKTEEDYLWLMQSEWSASIYHDDDIGPYLPALNVEGCFAEAGKIFKLGKDVKQALQVVTERAKLEYEGPRKLDKMWQAGTKFADVRGVKIAQKKIMRCRPIFLKWAAEFQVAYMADVLKRDEIVRVLEEAGRRIGIGTYRPRFGRFSVKVLS